MFLELDNELINLENVSKIKKTQLGDEWRIVFLSSDKEVKNLSFASEQLMLDMYVKLKNFLITKKTIKRLGELV